MTEFEDNLWREVERTYGSELSDAPDPLRQRSRLRVPVLAGTSLGVVGGSVAAVIVLTASSSPAFAVTRHSDGTVSVVIRRMEGIAGANRRLQLLGIRARAVRVSGVCTAAPPQALAQVTVATVRGRRVDWVGAATSRMAQRIRPAQIPSGRTLVIPAVPGGALVRLVHGRAVSGRVPACLPPVVLIRPGSGPAGGRIVICRAGFTEYPRAVVTGAGTNTTGTNTTGTNTTGTNSTGTNSAGTNSAGTNSTGTNSTGTNPPPPSTTAVTTTNTNAATSTNAGAATGTTAQGAATSGQPTTDSPPSGGFVQVPAPLLRHCPIPAQRVAP